MSDPAQEVPDGDTRFGFKWGPVAVERLADLPRDGGRCRVIGVYRVEGPNREGLDKILEIYVSPKGQSVRVWRGGKELT